MQRIHNWDFEGKVQQFPELATKKFVAISDSEFTCVMTLHFKKAFVALDEIHVSKDIKRFVKTEICAATPCTNLTL